MSFELFLSSLSPIADKGFSELEKYGEKEAYITSSLSASYESLILSEILGQPPLNNPEYSIFQCNMQTHKLELMTNFMEKNIIYPFNFQIIDSGVIVNCLSVHSLGFYLISSKNRYTFSPIQYESDAKQSGHRATIVIDNKDSKVYLLDPNGEASYFNNIVGNIDNVIESFCEQYFNMVNGMFQTKYKYVRLNVWNRKGVSINNTSNAKISNGDCMILSMILCHLIKTLEMTPEQLYAKFKDMSDDEVVSLIRSYSMGLIRYLRPIKKDKSLDRIDGLYKVYEIVKDDMANFKTFSEFNQYVWKMKGKLPELYTELLTACNVSVY